MINFRAEQILSKARSTRLAFLFLAAVLSTGMMLYVYWILVRLLAGPPPEHFLRPALAVLWDSQLFVRINLFTIVLIAAGSGYKWFSLRAGGPAVGRLLHARRIDPETENLGERRLLNVIEEMALASAVPAPQAWLLEGVGSINAFAAGHTSRDAIIGVTRGSLELLTREELQGVIAHEFSHIKNGDMRINIRLIAWLHGIIMIALLGEILMYAFSLRLGRRVSQATVDEINITPAGLLHVLYLLLGGIFILLGFLVLGIGCAGQNFARAIRNSISRQRELLADAAAVEFTRNPAGLAGALKKIGSLSAGSMIEDTRTELLSHIFFSDATRCAAGAGSTHPDLRFRIWRLDPEWDGHFVHFSALFLSPVNDLLYRDSPIAGTGSTSAVQPQGSPDYGNSYAAAIVRDLPAGLRKLARKDYGREVILATLLIDTNPEARARQLTELGQRNDCLRQRVEALLPGLDSLELRQRLMLIDLVLPALGKGHPAVLAMLHADLSAIVAAGERSTIFESMLLHCIDRLIPPGLPPGRREPLTAACAAPHYGLVLSTLAHAGAKAPAAVSRLFGLMRVKLELEEGAIHLRPREECRLPALEAAAEALRGLTTRERARLVEVCHDCVNADGCITPLESQLLRLVAVMLDVPLPPVLPTPAGEPAGGVS